MEVEGRRVVFSGDVKAPEELLPLMDCGCDLLLHETGHHAVADVCRFAARAGAARLVFLHHGREIMENRPSVAAALAGAKLPVTVARDGETIEW
jgi:ribonuclease BN (tRNA processing enzyme)